MTTAASSAPTTRIVIVEGQEFTVEVTATEQEIRQHLAQLFPNITTATLNRGKRKVGEAEYETWEFVKRAGTKGNEELAALVATVPPLRVGSIPVAQRALIARLRERRLTVAEALHANVAQLIAALPTPPRGAEGATLCSSLDALTPVAGSGPSEW